MTIDIQEMYAKIRERAEHGSDLTQYLRFDGIDGDPQLKVYLRHSSTDLPAVEVKLGVGGRGALRPRKYQGVEVTIETLQWGDGKPSEMAIIFCRVESLADVFQRFIQTIVDNLSRNLTPTNAVSSAIDKWVTFFTKSSDKKDIHELMGLYGELKFLEERIKLAKNSKLILECWKGPEGNSWDYIFPAEDGGCFVEIKTTGLDRRKIKVNGFDQLYPADLQRNSYWLYWLRVNHFTKDDGVDKGSILELIKRLQDFCSNDSESTRLLLDEILRTAELLDINDDAKQLYQQIKFTPGKASWISINSTFPALHRGNIANVSVLDRVTELQYTLNLKDEDISKEGPSFHLL